MDYNIIYTTDSDLFSNMFKLYHTLEDQNFFNKISTFETKDKMGDRRELVKLSFPDEKFNKFYELIYTKGREGRDIVNRLSCPLCNIFKYGISRELDKIKALSWRKYYITPNSFPYFPFHFIIQTNFTYIARINLNQILAQEKL